MPKITINKPSELVDHLVSMFPAFGQEWDEEQFKLFGEKYYTLLIKGLESGKQFDKAFDVAIEAITSDIDNGVLPKRSTSQKLQSFYLNVGKCSAKRLEDNDHKT